jgi:uncharacterized protein
LTPLWLLLIGLAAGAVNALAGGGTFLVFPALLFAGVASVKANATSTLIMVPGAAASLWVYRRTLHGVSGKLLAELLISSFAGGLLGSWLLLNTSNRDFSSYVPWLLLIAAVVFTATPRLRRLARHDRSPWIVMAGQFLISIYGGYFGAGMGVLMLALYLAAVGMEIQPATGLRIACAVFVNMVALTLFVWRGAIDWKLGIPMTIAGIAGGYAGATVMRRMNDEWIRKSILVYAWGLTVYFFVKELTSRQAG